jgi:hypothetical protein
MLLGWSEGQPLPENWVEVKQTTKPQESETTIAYQLEPKQNKNGTWEMVWDVRDLTDEELYYAKLSSIRVKVQNREPLTKDEAELLIG